MEELLKPPENRRTFWLFFTSSFLGDALRVAFGLAAAQNRFVPLLSDRSRGGAGHETFLIHIYTFVNEPFRNIFEGRTKVMKGNE